MTVKNSNNVIYEFTQLTNTFLENGYYILEVQSDPNRQQNQAIVLSKNIVQKKVKTSLLSLEPHEQNSKSHSHAQFSSITS